MTPKSALVKFCCFILVFLLAFSALQPSVFAVGSSGFENASYSARSLAQSNAVVARPEEPSTVAFNPAGIPELNGIQTDGNLAGLVTHTWHKSAVSHNTEKNTPQMVLVPTGFLTANLGDKFDNRVGVGFGLTFPFGLSNRYPSQSAMARYAGFRNQIKLAALTYAVGVKLTDKINIGGAAVNYQIHQYDQIFNYPNTAVLGFGPDGQINTYQKGSAWGWTLGTLVKPTEQHHLGAYYRSKANVRTSGRVKVTGLVLGELQGFDTTPYWESAIHSDVQLPSNVTVAYAYIPSDKWAAEIDLAWTGWSVFADQNVTVDRPNAVTQSLGYIPRNYHNTLSLNMGGHYRLNQKFDLLGGMFFYSAASPKENFDSVIPDSNRYATTFGFTYNVTKNLDFSLTYLLNLFEKRSIENREYLAKNRVRNDGEYITFLHGFMSGFTYRFGEAGEKRFTNSMADKGNAPVVKHIPAAVK